MRFTILTAIDFTRPLEHIYVCPWKSQKNQVKTNHGSLADSSAACHGRAPCSTAASRIYLALDVPTGAKADSLIKQFSREEVGGFKVGAELFLAEGPSVCDLVVGLGHKLFH